MKYLCLSIIIFCLYLCFGCAVHSNSVSVLNKEKSTVTEENTILPEGSLRCITCHKNRGISRNWFSVWQEGIHAKNGVGCETCHVQNLSKTDVFEKKDLKYYRPERGNCDDERVQRQVFPDKCGKCHAEQYNNFMKSGHATSWEMMINTCDSLIPKSTFSTKCRSCHDIQFRCDSCHTRHIFYSLDTNSPEVCKTCHSGAGDHLPYETYTSSRHGTLYKRAEIEPPNSSQSASPSRAPVCVTCHMPEGTHNTRYGLTNIGIKTNDHKEMERKRNEMIVVCTKCHSRSSAKRTLDYADTIQKEVNALVEEAKKIIIDLEQENVISPVRAVTSDTVLPGHVYTIEGLHYSRTKTEQLFLTLSLCKAVITKKAAYHMNPNYVNLKAWPELHKYFYRLQEEANNLRKEKRIQKRLKTKLR